MGGHTLPGGPAQGSYQTYLRRHILALALSSRDRLMGRPQESPSRPSWPIPGSAPVAPTMRILPSWWGPHPPLLGVAGVAPAAALGPSPSPFIIGVTPALYSSPRVGGSLVGRAERPISPASHQAWRPWRSGSARLSLWGDTSHTCRPSIVAFGRTSPFSHDCPLSPF